MLTPYLSWTPLYFVLISNFTLLCDSELYSGINLLMEYCIFRLKFENLISSVCHIRTKKDSLKRSFQTTSIYCLYIGIKKVVIYNKVDTYYVC